jgi:hypothetical protein
MTIYLKKQFPKFIKIFKKYQTKTIMSFLKSGIIVKHISNHIIENMIESINLFVKTIDIDYHPNSNNKVIDIVHPSLYPLSKLIKQNNNLTDYWNRPYEESKFQ